MSQAVGSAPVVVKKGIDWKALGVALVKYGWKYGWMLAPITILFIGWGIGQTFAPDIHTRIVVWQPTTEPLFKWWLIEINPAHYPVVQRLPFGNAFVMGILAMLCIGWGWGVHAGTRGESASAVSMKRICQLSAVILIVLWGVFVWKLGRGTAPYWYVPSLVTAFVALFLAQSNMAHTLAGRDQRRGIETKD